jgi:hypothetical protein
LALQIQAAVGVLEVEAVEMVRQEDLVLLLLPTQTHLQHQHQ